MTAPTCTTRCAHLAAHPWGCSCRSSRIEGDDGTHRIGGERVVMPLERFPVSPSFCWRDGGPELMPEQGELW